MKAGYSLAILPLLLLLAASQASANAPIGAIAFLAYPTLSYFLSSFVALFIAVAVETVVFTAISKQKPLKGLWLILKANVFSGIIGVLIIISCSFGLLFFLAMLPMAIVYGKMFRYVCDKGGYFTKVKSWSLMIFIGMQIAVMLLAWQLLPVTSTTPLQPNPGQLSEGLIVGYATTLILIGFLVTNIAEIYYVLKNRPESENPDAKLFIKAAVWMNFASYLALSAVYGKFVLSFVLRGA